VKHRGTEGETQSDEKESDSSPQNVAWGEGVPPRRKKETKAKQKKKKRTGKGDGVSTEGITHNSPFHQNSRKSKKVLHLMKGAIARPDLPRGMPCQPG